MSQSEIKSDQPQAAKPSSPRKIAASRANGALSAGPATPTGQAASAAAPKNFRHGMLAQTVVLASESRARFEELVDALIAEHRPSTKTERALIDNTAVARWRQMRTWSIQKKRPRPPNHQTPIHRHYAHYRSRRCRHRLSHPQ